MANKKQSENISKRMKRRAEERRKKRLTILAVIAVVIIVLAGVGFAVLLNNNNNPGDAAQGSLPLEISVEQAYQMVDEGAFLLDVRTPEEWDDFHAPQATLIPLDELANRVDEVPADRDIVVICRSGNRSQVGRDTLLTAGYTSVTSVDGGMNAWRSAGYATE